MITSATGEATCRNLVRLLIQDAQHRSPQPLPVVVVLDGDYTGQLPRALDELVDVFLETSGVVFGIKDRDSPKEPQLSWEQGELLHYMADKTGGIVYQALRESGPFRRIIRVCSSKLTKLNGFGCLAKIVANWSARLSSLSE